MLLNPLGAFDFDLPCSFPSADRPEDIRLTTYGRGRGPDWDEIECGIAGTAGTDTDANARKASEPTKSLKVLDALEMCQMSPIPYVYTSRIRALLQMLEKTTLSMYPPILASITQPPPSSFPRPPIPLT